MGEAIPHPVLGSQYCFPDEREFLLSEKISVFGLGGDNFTVSDNNGNKVFKVDNSLLAATDKMRLKDAQTGEVVAIVRKKIFDIGETWVVANGAGEHVAEIKDPVFNVMPSLHVKLMDGSAKLEVEGGFLQKHFKIKRERLGFDPVIATVKKQGKFHGVGAFIKQGLLDTQTYYVHVDAGEDAALMICIAVIIDEIYNEVEAKKKAVGDD